MESSFFAIAMMWSPTSTFEASGGQIRIWPELFLRPTTEDLSKDEMAAP